MDDEPAFVEMVADFLRRADERFEVVSATAASQGLTLLRNRDVDCIVSDFDMPGMDGLEFLAEVRDEHGDLPFVLFTAKGDEELASEAISAGVTDYLQKSRGTDQYSILANRIGNVVEGYRSRWALEERNQRLETLINNLPGVVYRCRYEPDRPITYIEGECEALTGYPSTKLEDEAVSWGEDVVHPDDRESIWQSVQNAVEAGEPFDVTYRILTGDGTVKWVWDRGNGVHSADGDLEGFEGFITGLEKRKRYEQIVERLHEATRRLMTAETRGAVLERGSQSISQILGFATNSIRLYDPETDRLLVETRSVNSEEVLGELKPYDVADTTAGRAFRTGDPVIEDIGRTDPYGRSPLSHSMYVPIGDHGVVSIGLVDREFSEDEIRLVEILAGNIETALDNLEHQSRFQEREKRLERYERMANTAADMVYILDENGHFQFVNDAAVELTGYARGDLVGEHVELLMEAGDIEHGRDLIRHLLAEDENGSESYEWTLHTADGESIPCESHISLLLEDGEFQGTTGVTRDISVRKEPERELERQNERLEEFADVVSHDLRNPLNVAVGRLELARDEGDSDHLDAARDALNRMARLIENLLALAREGKVVTDVERVELDEAVRRSWKNVETADAALVVDTHVSVEADQSRLEQLLENLYRNAIDHGGEDVTLQVGDLDHLRGFYIEDDGPGIPSDERQHVFESGYSSAPDGTGLGLFLVQQIAEAHGWSVAVRTGTDGGARFEIAGVESC